MNAQKKPERGQYRSITLVLLDGPDFQALPAEARWVFVALKVSLGPCGIQVEYPDALVPKLAARTGYSTGVVGMMLDALQAAGWVRAERNIVWAVGQLQNEPSLSPRNPNHKPTILSHIKGLPRLGLVGDFIRASRDYFEEPDELAKAYPTTGAPVAFTPIPHPIPHPMGDHRQGQGDRREKTEEVATTSADAVERRIPEHTLRSCLGLVVETLYFGNRPPEAAMRNEASIAQSLGEHYGYDRLAKAISGLARRRAKGELGNVGPRQALSLKWLNSKKFEINQLAASEDAFYRSDPEGRRQQHSKVTDISDVLATVTPRAG